VFTRECGTVFRVERLTTLTVSANGIRGGSFSSPEVSYCRTVAAGSLLYRSRRWIGLLVLGIGLFATNEWFTVIDDEATQIGSASQPVWVVAHQFLTVDAQAHPPCTSPTPRYPAALLDQYSCVAYTKRKSASLITYLLIFSSVFFCSQTRPIELVGR